MAKFNTPEFVMTRQLLRTIGFWMVPISIGMFIIDWSSPFPTPVRGAGTIWWLFLFGAGAIIYWRSYRLPVDEMILIAPEYDGELNIPTVMQAIRCDQSTAETILKKLVERGVAKKRERAGEDIWVLPSVYAHRLYEKVLEYGRRSGKVSPGELSTRFEMSLDEAEKVLLELQNKGYCKPPEEGRKRWMFHHEDALS